MTDPFARLGGDAAKNLQKGYKALKAKKLDEAAAAFKAVTEALPDYSPARLQLVRALAFAGNFAEVPPAYEALLARDYVAYAPALDAHRELAPLRGSPAWAKIGELKARYREAYAKGLDAGFFLVARTHPATEPKFEGAVTDAALDLKQEVFHYDPDGKRFRRLTDTAGHAFAIARSPAGKSLAFLSAPRLHREGGVDSFVNPELGAIDLATLETVGPFVAKGRFQELTLGYDKAGQPLFVLLDSTTHATEVYAFDTARTALAKLSAPTELAGGETRASPSQIARSSGRTVEGVKLAEGANQFTVEGAPAPVVAARPLEPASLDWSPGRTRLTYAGKIDACKVLRGQNKDKNELYVYDLGKKSAQRIAAAVSLFETLWLDDDRLVYEGGVGKDGQIHVYALGGHADSVLPTRYGAGLYGVPTLACEAEDATLTDEGAVTNEEEGD
jgi:hypothetical protein